MKGLEFESYVCQLHVSLIVYYFDNIRDHDEWQYNPGFIVIITKHELVELVVHLHWYWRVMGLNLGLREISSFLAKFLFGMTVKEHKP